MNYTTECYFLLLFIYFDNLKAGVPLSNLKESEGPQSAVQFVEICSNYFPPIVLVPLPDCRTMEV